MMKIYVYAKSYRTTPNHYIYYCGTFALPLYSFMTIVFPRPHNSMPVDCVISDNSIKATALKEVSVICIV